jgi:sortase A
MRSVDEKLRRSLRSGALWLQRLGAVGLAAVLVVIGAAELHAARQSRRLDDLRAAAASGSAQARRTAARAEIEKTGLVGRVEIERLGLRAMVEEGTSRATLRRGAGHLPESVLPGEDGNVVLAGHRDSVFRPLRDVVPGDVVRVMTLGGTYEYEVSWAAIVEPSDTRVLQPSSEALLTLVTCYPFAYVGPAPQRFVVRARRLAPGVAAADGL